MRNYIFGDYIEGKDIKRCRNMLGLTQERFSEFVGMSKKTIERWESNKSPITGPIIPLIKFLSENSQFVEKMEIPEKKYRLRLWYMYGNDVCTIIDVDNIQKLVEIKNYTKFTQYRAFGNVEEPTYEQYEEFLESRCFPRERDKMKLHLKALNLPFYDPFMIVEKTEGRMAEDDFWIRIER